MLTPSPRKTSVSTVISSSCPNPRAASAIASAGPTLNSAGPSPSAASVRSAPIASLASPTDGRTIPASPQSIGDRRSQLQPRPTRPHHARASRSSGPSRRAAARQRQPRPLERLHRCLASPTPAVPPIVGRQPTGTPKRNAVREASPNYIAADSRARGVRFCSSESLAAGCNSTSSPDGSQLPGDACEALLSQLRSEGPAPPSLQSAQPSPQPERDRVSEASAVPRHRSPRPP